MSSARAAAALDGHLQRDVAGRRVERGAVDVARADPILEQHRPVVRHRLHDNRRDALIARRRGPGSHVTVTLVRPFGPRDMPIHGRMYGLECDGRNGSVGRGAAACGGSGERRIGAQYPERDRACAPGRFTRTCTGWNCRRRVPSGVK